MKKTEKSIPCVICQKPVVYQSRMTDHPESPEIFSCQQWLGVFEGEEDGMTRLLGCCSEECVAVFFLRGDAEEPEPLELEDKGCQNCLNQCMDMDLDPYCGAVNKPFGQVLHRGKPAECGPENKLWQLDTRRSKIGRL